MMNHIMEVRLLVNMPAAADSPKGDLKGTTVETYFSF
jgi:hypothetical protein